MSEINLKFEFSNDLITGRTGLIILDEFWKKFDMSKTIDDIFGAPGSNRGIKASKYIRTILEMIIDGGENLEDVKKLESDEAYKKMMGVKSYPTSDAIGDWLRRQGQIGGEKKIRLVNNQLLKINKDENVILDVDATIIESDKGDGTKSYKGIVGYHPYLGMTVENGLIIGSKFRYGNENPSDNLLGFIKDCNKNIKDKVKIIRSDSAGYNHAIINYCTDTGKYFSISADHDSSVLSSIGKIEKDEWKWGKNRDGSRADWKVAETIHTMNDTKESFRLVVKRKRIKGQLNLFNQSEYSYWIIATNLPFEQYDSNAVILFQQSRGEMERLIGEFKHQYNMEHMPCGQFDSNSMYFSIGVLAYNIIQIIKEIALDREWLKRSIKSIRYNLIHIPSKLVTSSRYIISKIVCLKENYDIFLRAFMKLKLCPLPYI